MRKVTDGSAWPSMFDTARIFAPLEIAIEAAVSRKSLGVSRSMPAATIAGLKKSCK